MRSTGTEPGEPAYRLALRLLADRDYTVAALARKLDQRGHAPEEVAGAVARLVAERFLDDRRYAEHFIVQARESGRYVGYRLRQELRRRGVPSELLGELLAERADRGEEADLARRLVARRYAEFDPATSDDRLRRRVAGFLQRRGFCPDVIRHLLERRRQVE